VTATVRGRVIADRAMDSAKDVAHAMVTALPVADSADHPTRW
jgi:hypothetical protein